MQSTALDLGKRVFRKIESIADRSRSRRQRERVERIVAGTEHRHYDSEDVFARLQDTYPPRPDYGYDPQATWWRGVQRANWLLPLAGIREPGARVLDVACGDGMFGRALADYGHVVALTDVEDWRDRRANRLPFVEADAALSIPLEPETFDVVTSYNAFIHFADPSTVLNEMLRVCRPGGIVHVDFGFLYPSSWGLHAYRTARMPYAQFLFSPDFLRAKLDELGFHAWPARLGKPTKGLIPLNGWRLAQYQETFAASGCEILSMTTREDDSHLDLVERFPGAFARLDLTATDLVTTMCTATLRKPAVHAYAAGSPSVNGAP